MKLWKGRFKEEADPTFEQFNRSLDVDAVLIEVDVRASRAHARALRGCGVLTEEEWSAIDRGLAEIAAEYDPEKVRATGYEDVHTFVEATLAEKIGPTGLKLHTGRSRNDQVAADFRLFVRKAIEGVSSDLEALQAALLESAESHPDTLLPGYTHLRRAQPIRWAHYCLAYVEMFARDRERFGQSLARVNVLPLGSGAIAGSNFPLDREALARELGFSTVSANSLDATSDRDFVVEFLSNAALLMVHASRLAEDWILYSTEEFGFLELSETVTTGSSLMPQKKNPDGLELVRAKTATTAGLLSGFLSLMKGLPSGYNKDLQEDKEAVFIALRNVRLSLAVLTATVKTAILDEDRMKKAAADPAMGAADLADFLVKKGVPFRIAHETVGAAVRYAVSEHKRLDQIDLTAFSPHFAELPPGFLSPQAAVDRKDIEGGTGRARVRAALDRLSRKNQ